MNIITTPITVRRDVSSWFMPAAVPAQCCFMPLVTRFSSRPSPACPAVSWQLADLALTTRHGTDPRTAPLQQVALQPQAEERRHPGTAQWRREHDSASTGEVNAHPGMMRRAMDHVRVGCSAPQCATRQTTVPCESGWQLLSPIMPVK